MADNKDTSPEVDTIRRLGYQARKKRKRLEQYALIATLTLIGLVGALAWYTDGQLFTKPWRAIMSLEDAGKHSPNAAINCRNPKNKNTVYCQERQGSVEADWHRISRYGGGKSNAFTLHGKR